VKPTRWLLVIGVVALLALRYLHGHALPDQARKTMLLRLKADYSAPVLDARGKESVQTTAQRLEAAQDVRIESVAVRGLLYPKYVQAEISVDGKPPPDGRRVRYFELDMLGNATALPSGSHYYLRLW